MSGDVVDGILMEGRGKNKPFQRHSNDNCGAILGGYVHCKMMGI